jgi:hypothetical protein
VKTVPYAGIRLGAGALAAMWSVYVFETEGTLQTAVLGVVFFVAGWFVARRFGRPVGDSKRAPWLDTVLPIAIAGFALLPAALYPFLGKVSIATVAAIVVLFFAGLSISLGFGPYRNEKVALVTR